MEELVIYEAPKACSFCSEVVPITNTFCANCGYPEYGTKTDISYFYSKRARQEKANTKALTKIKSAQIALFILAGIIYFSGMLSYNLLEDKLLLLTNSVLALLYVALAFWSGKNPIMGLLLGLLLYFTLLILSAVLDPASVYKGLILKTIVVVYLGKGLHSATRIKQQFHPLIQKK